MQVRRVHTPYKYICISVPPSYNPSFVEMRDDRTQTSLSINTLGGPENLNLRGAPRALRYEPSHAADSFTPQGLVVERLIIGHGTD